MTAGRFRMRPCAISGVEAVEADSAHSFGRHMHDQFGIGLIVGGAQKSASGRGPVEAGAGDIITVNPGEVHDGCPIGDHGRSWRMLYLDPAVMAAAIADISNGRTADFVFTHPVISDRQKVREFCAVYAGMTETTNTLAPEAALLQLVASLAGELREPHFLSPAIGRAREKIDDDPAAAITLADLAAASGLSRFQMVRHFNEATGLTPHAYLVQRRLAVVRQMIAKGSSLADASFAGGFADQSHMTRTFVRAYGITPGAYASAVG